MFKGKSYTVLVFLLVTQLSAQKVVVSATEMRVFYQHIDNPVDIAIENCDCKNIVPKVDKGKLEGNGCSYIYRTDTAYKIHEVKLSVGVKKNGKVQWKEKFNIRVKRLPSPDVMLFPKGGRSFSKNDFYYSRIVAAPISPFGELFISTKTYDIKSYTFSIKRNDSILYNEDFLGYGMNLNHEEYDTIKGEFIYNYGIKEIPYETISFINKNCKIGDKIIFSNIMALLYQVEVRKMEDLEIIISN